MKIKAFSLAIIMGLTLTGCLTTSPGYKTKESDAADSEAQTQTIQWEFMGNKPTEWEATIQDRHFQMVALRLTENRFTDWEIEENDDQIILSVKTKNPVITITNKECEASGFTYRYAVEIETGGRIYSGCGVNKALSVETGEDGETSQENERVEIKDKRYSETVGQQKNRAVTSLPTLHEKEEEKSKELPSRSSSAKVAVPSMVVSNDSRWIFSGRKNGTWSGIINGRQFQFQGDGVSENRRLGWKITSINGQPQKMESTTGGIIINLAQKSCDSEGERYPFSAQIRLNNETYKGCARSQ